MIFCKQNALSDIFLTFENDCYILAIRSSPPKTCLFNDKAELIEKLCQLQVEGFRIPDYVFGALEEWE